MKTLFALTLLALVACSYAAPTQDLATALLNQLEDAKLTSLLDVQTQEDDETALLNALMQNDEDQDDSVAQLEALLKNAQIEGWKSHLKKLKDFGKKAYNGAKKVASNPMVKEIGQKALEHYMPEEAEAQDEDIALLMAVMEDDDNIAQLESLMKDARFQGWFKSLGKKLKSFGKKVASGIKKVGVGIYKGAKKVVSNPIVKGILKKVVNKYSPIPIPIKAESQNDDDLALLLAMVQEYDNDNAEVEAMLSEAEIEGWLSSLKKYGKKALTGIKKAAENPMVREIGMKALEHAANKYSPINAESQNDDDLALLLAMVQEYDNDNAEVEAMLSEAEIEGWLSSLKKYGKKALTGIKKAAENPMVKEIGMKALEHYIPEKVETQEDERFTDLLDSLLDA